MPLLTQLCDRFCISFPYLQGDSGGPVVCRLPGQQSWKLYAITSWGYGCSGKGVYARVSNYLDWIDNILEEIKSTQVDA